MSIADLLNRAKINIEAGEDRLHQAAEDIAAASEQGATQRKIAELVGKSVDWRLAGYSDHRRRPAAPVSAHVSSRISSKPLKLLNCAGVPW